MSNYQMYLAGIITFADYLYAQDVDDGTWDWFDLLAEEDRKQEENLACQLSDRFWQRWVDVA